MSLNRSFTALCIFSLTAISFTQTWTPLKNPPTFGASNELLLTDGTVLVQDGDASDWWKLTPDITGSYVNGTWTKIATTPGYGPLYYASQVLSDGRVFVMGGEYNESGFPTWINQGYIYNPVTNVWTALAAPPGWSQIGDMASVTLNNGSVMVADPLSNQCALFNPSTNTFTVPYGSGKPDGNDEEGLTRLPNGNVLSVETVNIPQSEIFNPTTGLWSSAGSTGNPLADPGTEEIGPAVLRPDGTVIQFGGTGHNGIFNSNTSTWSAGPDFPMLGTNQLACLDAPACLLPSGNVLVQASAGYAFGPSEFFEFNGSTLTQVPSTASAPGEPAFVGIMLMLPTGQVLWTSQSSDMEIYTPAGSPNPAWAPKITSSPSTVREGFTYTLSGTQLNGLSGDSAFGDDVQNETDYPLIRITNNSTHHVFYCREYSPSTSAICTGNATVSTHFSVPSAAELGASTLQVVTNGIPSNAVPIVVYPAVEASSVSLFQGVSAVGTVQSVWTIDGNTYNVTSSNSAAGQQAAALVTFVFPNSNINSLKVAASAAAIPGATGMLYAYDWQTGTYDFLSSAALSSSQTQFSGSTSLTPGSRYVGPGGVVKIVVRGVLPSHVSPLPFTLKIDFAGVSVS